MKKLLLAILFLSMYSIHADNKLIYMVCPPCSGGAAFLRMMRARPDCIVFHEPYACAFYHETHPNEIAPGFNGFTLRNFDQVKKAVTLNLPVCNVFVKDISSHVAQALLDDEELVKNPNVHFVFLLRDPHASLLSYYNKSHEIPNERFGYRAMNYIFEKVKRTGVNPPLIIFAEDLFANPEATVAVLCQKVNIPFAPHSFHWSDLGTHFKGLEWNVGESPDALYAWHERAIRSTGFGRLTTYEVDKQGKPTFSEVADEQDRQKLKECYLFNMPFYAQFKAEEKFFCHRYAVSPDQIRNDAQQWIQEQAAGLSADELYLLGNFLFFETNATLMELAIISTIRDINGIENALSIEIFKNDRKSYMQAQQLIERLQDLKKELESKSDAVEYARACYTTISGLEESPLKDAIETLGMYRKRISAHLVRQDYEALMPLLRSCCDDLADINAKNSHCLATLQAIKEDVNPYFDESTCDDKSITNMDLALASCNVLRDSLAATVSALYTVKSLEIDLAQINAFIYSAFYDELYSLLHQDGKGIPYLFNEKGFIPAGERKKYLPPLQGNDNSAQSRVAHSYSYYSK